jgi:aspartyl-tRNA(Asn)/glutamyl-tRNA(Gln) amidotransferase subunit A
MAADAGGIATLRTEPSDLAFLGATEIAERYADRSLSPTELVDHLLARIAALDWCVQAFIRLDADRARGAAVAAEIAAGRSRGSLHGIPVAIKDMIDVADTPTTCHSRILLDNVARADVAVVAGLREAGAIIIGKVATHEFATGGPIFDLPFPPARNPWNLDCHPGGSSSGSGAGLAAGFFPLSLGTDTAGSARNPAGACGVVGLKPTYGLVSRRGVFPLAHTLDHVGVLARSVGDAALLLDAIAGHDPADPASVRASLATPDLATADLSRGLRGLRIGYVRHFHETDIPADPEVAAALDNVARVLAAEGAAVTEVILPPLARFTAVNRVIMHAEAFAIHARWLQTSRRLWPNDAGKPARRCLPHGRRLCPGAQRATPLDRRCGERFPRSRRASDGGHDGAAHPDPRFRSDRAKLSASGTDAIQCHGTSGPCDDVRVVCSRPSAFGTVRRALLRGAYAGARGRRV